MKPANTTSPRVTRPLKIYVSAPYTPKTDNIHEASRLAHQNVKKALKAGLEIIKLGHFPFIPHLTHYLHIENEHEISPEFWYSYDLAWLKHCDAVVFLDGWQGSRGCMMELEAALDRGIKIFFGLGELERWLKNED